MERWRLLASSLSERDRGSDSAMSPESSSSSMPDAEDVEASEDEDTCSRWRF